MTMMIEWMMDVTDAMDVMNVMGGCMPGGFARTEG